MAWSGTPLDKPRIQQRSQGHSLHLNQDYILPIEVIMVVIAIVVIMFVFVLLTARVRVRIILISKVIMTKLPVGYYRLDSMRIQAEPIQWDRFLSYALNPAR